jgi:hypothetical protein
MTIVDCKGRPVKLGDLVRITQLPPAYLAKVEPADRVALTAMIGKVYIVDDIDDFGQAWVTEMRDNGDGTHDGTGVGLASDEMELIDPQ